MLEPFDGAPIQLLQFDLDGTLIDSVPQLAKAVNAALVSCSLPPVTLQQVAVWIGNGADMLLRRAWARGSDPGIGPEPQLFSALRQAFDAHMRINNGLTNIPLENVQIELKFSDKDGNPVPSTYKAVGNAYKILFHVRSD